MSNYMSPYDRKIDGLRKEKNEALKERDALRYYGLCNSLGIEPEDNELYESGQAELEIRKDGISDLVKMANNSVAKKLDEKGLAFLKEAKPLINDTFNHTEQKKSILMKHFKRFASGGKQDLSRSECGGMINSIFCNIYSYYHSGQLRSQ